MQNILTEKIIQHSRVPAIVKDIDSGNLIFLRSRFHFPRSLERREINGRYLFISLQSSWVRKDGDTKEVALLITATDREKRYLALTSIGASLTLTVFKLVAALLSNSLGLLSETLHSGLDLAAAFTTYYAVIISSRPPDPEHRYGHGKAENLSGFVESIILLLTSLWIVYEALSRLLLREPQVSPGLIGFGVMVFAIAIDFSRSRILMKAGVRFRSHALQADALHFQNDIMTSSVVIIGLFFAAINIPVADSLAGLGVAAFVIYSGMKMGKKTVDVLLDRAPSGSEELVRRELASIPEVAAVSDVRVREAGPQTFVDMHIALPRTLSNEAAHAIASKVESKIKEVIPDSDVIVHVDALPLQEEIPDKIRLIASKSKDIENVHSIRIIKLDQGLQAQMDLEMNPSLSLEEADKIVHEFEDAVKNEIKEITMVVTHLESQEEHDVLRAKVVERGRGRLIDKIRSIAMSFPGIKDCYDILITTVGDEMNVTMTCSISANSSVVKAHMLATQVQEAVILKTHATKVIVHTEPERR